jgi:hypothetical protein
MKEWVRAQAAPVKDPDVMYQAVHDSVTALGLPETDAIWFYQQMQRDGWKFCGVPVLDPRDLVQNFYQAKHFLSQRIVA